VVESPVLAAIILAFQEQKTWSLDDLRRHLNVPSDVIQKKISYWMSMGQFLMPACCVCLR
jgi:anaphase-promoting complex subunit 2